MAIMRFEAKLIEKKELSSDVVCLSFTVPEDFTFKAGQFITLMIEKDGKKLPRSYSILNPPKDKEKLDLCIKIIPGGFASGIFAAIKLGDTLEAKGPFGHFFLDEKTDTEHYFLATGTGIVPFYSLLKEYLDKKESNFTLLYGARTKQDMVFYEDFLQMEQDYDNFTFIPIVSREKWYGKMGHVQDHLPEDLQNKTFYICGLKDFVLQTKQLLLEKGIAKELIKQERYS